MGDTLYYGVKNVDKTGTGATNLHCIFYNGVSEISRRTILLTDSPYLTQSGVIPENTTRVLIRFQISSSSTISVSAEDFILSSTPLPSFYDAVKWVDSPFPFQEVITRTIAYVDAELGSDSKNGLSWTTPFATFQKAIEMTGAETTIYFRGETTETLNIKQKINPKYIKVNWITR